MFANDSKTACKERAGRTHWDQSDNVLESGGNILAQKQEVSGFKDREKQHKGALRPACEWTSA